MKNLDNNCIKTDGRNLYKIALFLCSLFLITTNCENDNDIFLEENKVNTSKEPVTVEQVFVEDIPHISNSIASMTYQYRGLNNEKENVNYTIDTERIIKAIDSIGNIT